MPKFDFGNFSFDQKNFVSVFFRNLYSTFPGLFSARLSLQEQSLFARRLSLLSKSGVPLFESVNILKRQTKGANRKMFDRISHDLSQGQYLSKALMRYRKVFGNFAINIIQVGETSGTIAENLKYLAEELDKKRELRGKVTSALVYPVIIALASLGICGFLTIYLFPKLMPIFLSLNVKLPLATRILIWVSRFLINYGWWLILGLILFIIAFIVAHKYYRFRFFVDRMILRIPFMGGVIQYYHLSNLTRTMGLLLKGQLRVIEAIEVARDTTASLPYAKELDHLKIAITKGSSIARHLEKEPKLFPSMLTEMVSVGETTGNLSETLVYLAQIYEQELAEKTKQLSSVIEPAMMIVMGVLVGFIAISIITPIYEVTQHLAPR